MRRGEAVDEQVVDERALRREQARVLRLTDGKLRRVVGRDALHGGQRVLAGDFDLAHVADVEQPGAGRGRPACSFDEAGILDRHVPAAKRHHLRAGRAVPGVEAASS